jgi:hypothetical protein
MSSGHLDEEPATKRATQAILDQNPDLVAFLATEPPISREYRIPYLGSISKDGKTVYIDRELPTTLSSGIEPDKYIALHERSEWWLMTRLGMDYGLEGSEDGAHHVAVRIEHDALTADGGNPDAYEDELVPFIKEAEYAKLRPDDLPPDMFLGPYEKDENSLDRRLLPILKAAAVKETGEKLGHAVVSYGPGSGSEFCRTCEYSDHAERPKCRFVTAIGPDGWCTLWDGGKE